MADTTKRKRAVGKWWHNPDLWRDGGLKHSIVEDEALTRLRAAAKRAEKQNVVEAVWNAQIRQES